VENIDSFSFGSAVLYIFVEQLPGTANICKYALGKTQFVITEED